MVKPKYALIFLIIAVLLIAEINAFAREDTLVRGIIDVHSKISDGSDSLEELVESAQKKGFSVLIFGDCALRKWEYGLWPLRNIIKKTHQENSVLRLGAEKYIAKITILKRQFPNLALITGVETSPYFYWEGSPSSRNFAVIDYYKQFLVFGLKPEDYRDLPIVGNRQFFQFSKNTFFGLWPILLIILGLRLLKRKPLAISFILAGVLFLLNNVPFPTSRFNGYQGNQGIKPYQELIDYVTGRGGFIFWAHPEMSSQKIYNYKTEFYTAPHIEDLFLTHDYTGFGLKHNLKMTEPQDIWDEVLLEYIQGKRKKPAWIVGLLHYTESFPLKEASPETLFFVKALSEANVLDAIRQGRMYVRFNLRGNPAILSRFTAEAVASDSIRIIIAGNQNIATDPLRIELIRNGKIFKTFEESNNEWMVTVDDNFLAQEKKVYYRLRITDSSTIILSNPIFMEH